MSILFPTILDAFTNPIATNKLSNPPHALQHANINDAVEAIEAAIGINPGKRMVASKIWNALAYGPDGTADDVELQQAIDDCSADGGGIVYVGEGNWSLSNNNVSPAAWSSDTPYYGILLPNNVKLIGAGIGKTIFSTPSYVGTGGCRYVAILCGEASGDADISVENCSFNLPAQDYVGGTYWAFAVMMASNRQVLRNIYSEHGGFLSGAFTASYSAATKRVTTDNNDAFYENITIANQLGSSVFAKFFNARAINLNFGKCYDDPLGIFIGGQHITIENFTVDGNGGTGGSSTAGLYLNNDHTLHADHESLAYIDIINPKIRNLFIGAGIANLHCPYVNVINPTIENGASYGIWCPANANHFKVIGGRISGNGNWGFYAVSGSAGLTCKNISLLGTEFSNNTGYGAVVSSSQANAINGVRIQDCEFIDDDAGLQTNGWAIGSPDVAQTNADIVISGNKGHGVTTPGQITLASSGTITGMKVINNEGYVTENSGTGTIANGATSAVITHGLSRTPTLQDIIITLGENPTNTPGAIWVDTIGATQFTVNCENDPGASGLDFSWKAIITRTSWS